MPSVLDTLWGVADRARVRRPLPREDVAFVRDVIPEELASYPRLALPRSIRHPAGFRLAGAPVGTLLRSALLVAATKALGPRYRGSPFYEYVEKDLALAIMRSNFHHGYPKGTHCCVQCTLAVLPALDAGAIRYFDCRDLAAESRRLITGRKWRFASPPNASLVAWAFGSAPR